MAVFSFEVSASVCSTAWRHQFGNIRQQQSSTWVKKSGGKDFSHLFTAIILQSNPVAPPASAEEMVLRRPAIKKRKSLLIAMSGQKQTTTCMMHPPETANRDIRNKETQMLNPLHRHAHSHPSALPTHFKTIGGRTSIESPNKPCSHGQNPCQISGLILYCIAVLPGDSFQMPKSSFKKH